MALLTPLWIQNATYPAQTDRVLIAELFPTAGVFGVADLAVTQRAAGTNMSVDVAVGTCAIAGTSVADQGSYLCRNTTVANVALGAAPGTGTSRIDLIVATVRDVVAAGGVNNDWTIQAVAGTPAASPAVPATPANSIVLAQVLVAAGTAAITNAMVTDRRTLVDRPAAPGKLLGRTAYTPGALTHYVGSGVLADVDAANAVLPAITVPRNISAVLVKASIFAVQLSGTATGYVNLAIRRGSTVDGAEQRVWTSPVGAGPGMRVHAEWLIGVTPLTSYTWKLAQNAANAITEVQAGGQSGPIVLEAYAA